MYCVARHLQYLQDTYPDVEVSLSFPRIRPLVRDFETPYPVSERRLVQIITAFRILFPHAGITLSTRESKKFRDGVLPLGITKMSAGVSTAVGGHSQPSSSPQFEIADTRSVEQVRADLIASGFQPVMHDWHRKLISM
jgi:2-iminoacetate synthase